MAWPWDLIGLPPDATASEVDAAYQRWRAQARRGDDPQLYERMEQAFTAALDAAGERDPSYLPHGADYPNPWRDEGAAAAEERGEAASSQDPRPDSLPPASPDVLATSILGLLRQAPDFDALLVAMTPVRGWRDPATRRAADARLRDWLVEGGQLSAAQVVRLSRLFDWTPQSEPLQDAERDAEWRRLLRLAHAELAPPDPAYTNAIGRTFLAIAIGFGVLLALLILPRILAGGVKLLIPILLAAACAWLLIRWRR